jgi:hypothetical protein
MMELDFLPVSAGGMIHAVDFDCTAVVFHFFDYIQFHNSDSISLLTENFLVFKLYTICIVLDSYELAIFLS